MIEIWICYKWESLRVAEMGSRVNSAWRDGFSKIDSQDLVFQVFYSATSAREAFIQTSADATRGVPSACIDAVSSPFVAVNLEYLRQSARYSPQLSPCVSIYLRCDVPGLMRHPNNRPVRSIEVLTSAADWGPFSLRFSKISATHLKIRRQILPFAGCMHA